jgi:hypothetical protein
MPNVLIRDVPDDDLEQIRAAAADREMSLQSYLREAVHAQATYLRRQGAIDDIGQRLRGRTPVPAKERRAVRDAVADAHDERAGRLGR